MTHPVVLLPSLGRGAADFDDLAGRLQMAGFETLALDPPTAVPPEATLHDLAAAVVAEIVARGWQEVHLIGHAFGQRLARCVVADAPERVRSLVMLAAGGLVPMQSHIAHSLSACFDSSAPADVHLDHVRRVFFAPGNDPAATAGGAWVGGWSADAAAIQAAATRATPETDWQLAAAPHVLVVQGLQDACAVPENGRRYVAAHPAIAELVEIDGAGHALLPEQPESVAAAVIGFLARVDPDR